MGLSGWDSNPGWREKLWVEILVVFGAQLCFLCVPDVCFFLSICLFIQHWKHFSSSTCLQKISLLLRLCSYLLLSMSPIRINFILTDSQRTKVMETQLHQELDIVTSFWKYHVCYFFWTCSGIWIFQFSKQKLILAASLLLCKGRIIKAIFLHHYSFRWVGCKTAKKT